LGSDNGRRTAAVLTSHIATCKRFGIAPFSYLLDLFSRITAHSKSKIAELFPDDWKPATPATPTC